VFLERLMKYFCAVPQVVRVTSEPSRWRFPALESGALNVLSTKGLDVLRYRRRVLAFARPPWVTTKNMEPDSRFLRTDICARCGQDDAFLSGLIFEVEEGVWSPMSI
jgi:hypothetical protein